MAYQTSLESTTTPKRSIIKSDTLSNLGSIVRLLPTGTMFMFRFLNPLMTNNGHCEDFNKQLCQGLIGFCGLSCFISSFTDSYMSLDGIINYGLTTGTGLWPSGDGSVDLSKYRLRIKDFVHAMLSLVVFGVLAVLDRNTVECFNPKLEKDRKLLITVLPPLIGMVSGTMFMMYPNKRHGIGYPLENYTDEENVVVKS